jgi:hypothetical protein
MMSQPDLTPDLGSGPVFEQALLAAAFRLPLADGRPVSPAWLVETLAGDPTQVERTLVWLDQHGRLRRDPAGSVASSHSLSVTPTSHELLLEQAQGGERRYWAWCAWDAVGILAALGANGRVHSTSPSSGQPIAIDFVDGMPANAHQG